MCHTYASRHRCYRDAGPLHNNSWPNCFAADGYTLPNLHAAAHLHAVAKPHTGFTFGNSSITNLNTAAHQGTVTQPDL